jgi:hypothetical protein
MNRDLLPVKPYHRNGNDLFVTTYRHNIKHVYGLSGLTCLPCLIFLLFYSAPLFDDEEQHYSLFVIW